MWDEWSPDPDVGCALPDLRPIALTAIGAVVVALALGVWVVRKWIPAYYRGNDEDSTRESS